MVEAHEPFLSLVVLHYKPHPRPPLLGPVNIVRLQVHVHVVGPATAPLALLGGVMAADQLNFGLVEGDANGP